MLKYDSTYGRSKGDIKVDGSDLMVDGKRLKFYMEKNLPIYPGVMAVLSTLSSQPASLPLSSRIRLILRAAIRSLLFRRPQPMLLCMYWVLMRRPIKVRSM